MKKIAFKLFMIGVTCLTGTGLGQIPIVKMAYQYFRRTLLSKDVVLFNIHGMKMYQHGKNGYKNSDETLFSNGYERMTTNIFNQTIKKGMTVIDVGANVGYYTLLACRNVGNKGKVIAYEPEPSNMTLLEKNVQSNKYSNALLWQMAVSDTIGDAILFLSTKGHGEHSLYESDNNVGKVTVNTTILDTIENADVIKMDIEGGEIPALIGMANLSDRSPCLKMLIEFYPPGIKRCGYEPQYFWDKLAELGFKYIYIINEKKHRLELGSCEKAVDYCRQRTKNCKNEVVSAVNLFCCKQPLLKVKLLGAYPPPYGGISVHVKRLKDNLESRDVSCSVDNYVGVNLWKRLAWLFKELFGDKNEIIHCHGYNYISLIGLSILSLRRKVVVTTHGFLFRKVPFKDKVAFKIASKTRIKFIVTSNHVKGIMESVGIKNTTDIITAFIPPSGVNDDVDKSILQFINAHNPVIVGNAYKIVFHNGIDLYGIDMCLDLCAELKHSYPHVGLVFCLPEIGDKEYFNKLQQHVRHNGIESKVLFVTKPYEFYPILRKCDLFVRPTCIDDYGISIAEAIYSAIPAIASNVCDRPQGCVTFKNRDTLDFSLKVRELLADYKPQREKLWGIKFEDNVSKIIDAYNKL